MMTTRRSPEVPGSGRVLGGAAYRNRTDDLRITRSPPNRSGLATCADSTTCVPECSQGTGCSGLPVHNPVRGVDRPSVTECHWMPDSTARSHRMTGPPNLHTGLCKALGPALTKMSAVPAESEG